MIHNLLQFTSIPISIRFSQQNYNIIHPSLVTYFIHQVKMVNIFHNCLCEQVRWPNGNKSNYRFGYKDQYDLILWYGCYTNEAYTIWNLKKCHISINFILFVYNFSFLFNDSDPRDPEVAASYKLQLEVHKQGKNQKSATWGSTQLYCVFL